MSKEQILIIEDEADILSMVSLRLRSRGFDVLSAATGEHGLLQIVEHRPDLILLDLMLPGMSGLDVLKKIRLDKQNSGIPILIVSALGEESDVVIGLELGADDYLSKPFNMPILVARVNALLRRHRSDLTNPNDIANDPTNNNSQNAAAKTSKSITIGTVRIDLDSHNVFVEDKEVMLTGTEFRLLAAMATSRGRIMTRNQLIDNAMGNDAIVTDRTIDVHFVSLRNKLGDARDIIETVRGVGYRLKCS
ncbi:MAG: response regulator transcription factor [Planctomycetaceae bacterium]|jgi:DNA-binding response OmpR family regulator|nr:response regulator transcription factor [Planctomycetaceae bacterium]